MALQTITPEHRDVRRITIHIPHHLAIASADANIGQTIGEAAHGQWLDLDWLLVQFWESRAILSKIICPTRKGEEQNTRNLFVCLLPELTRRGIIVLDLIEH